MFFGPTQLRFNLKLLKKELESLLKEISFHSWYSQICLNHRPEAKEDLFYDGIGSIYDRPNKKWLHKETDFSVFNKNLLNSYFYEVFQQIQSESPFQLGRMRLCRLRPSRCLTLHQDRDVRLHLAIQTNKESFLIFPGDGHYSVPEDGQLYVTDTRELHTAINGSKEDRIHLVFSTDTSPESPKGIKDFLKMGENKKMGPESLLQNSI